MRKKHTKFISGLLILVIYIALIIPIASATGAINVFMPSVSISLTGAPQEDPEDYEIVLEADDPAYPMPEGSVDGVYKLIITGDNMVTLPAIQFSSVGTYSYTISQTPGTNDLGNYDNSVYNITVYITNAPEGSGLESTVIVQKSNEAEKWEYIEFVNDYEIELPDEEIPGGGAEPTDPPSEGFSPSDPPDDEKPTPTVKPSKDDVPKTGDNTLIRPYILSFIGAGILLLVLLFTRENKVKE